MAHVLPMSRTRNSVFLMDPSILSWMADSSELVESVTRRQCPVDRGERVPLGPKVHWVAQRESGHFKGGAGSDPEPEKKILSHTPDEFMGTGRFCDPRTRPCRHLL